MDTKPRVIGLVGILLLRGVLIILISLSTINDVNTIGASFFPGWYVPLLYLLLLIGVGAFAGAVLIWMMKRLGLYLGIAVSAADIIIFVLLLLGGYAAFSGGSIVGLLISAAIIYYAYRYLNNEPEKLAFT
jgi:hypothetical protein